MPQLTISDLLRDTARTLVDRGPALAGLLILPVIAISIMSAGMEHVFGGPPPPPDPANPPEDITEIIGPAAPFVFVVGLLIQTPALAAWCRICLRIDAPLDALGPVDGRAIAFLRAEIAVFAAGLAVAAMFILFGLAIGGAGAQATQSALAFGLLGMAAFAVISPRLMLALPAAAAGDADQSLRTAWMRSQGCTASLFFATLAIMPLALLALVVAAAISALGPRLFDSSFAAALWSTLPAVYAELAVQCVLLTIIVRAYASLSGRGAANGSAAP